MTTTSRQLAIATTILALCGCAPSPIDQERGRVHLEAGVAGVALMNVRLQYSRWWPSNSGLGGVDGDGGFNPPAGTETVVAFIDTNHSGALEQFREPSTHCARSAGEWQCDLRRTRVVAHRTEVLRMQGGELERLGDEITVRAEQYLDDGRPASGTRFCLHDHRDACAFQGGDPLGPHDATAVSPCELKAALQQGASIPVDVEASDGLERSVTNVPYPAAIDPRVSTSTGANGLTVHVISNQSLTNAIAWYGEKDATRIYWSTEQDPDAIQIHGSGADITISIDSLPACANCRLMLQVAHVEESAGIGTFSEARVGLSLESR